jgi:hypothetical protein
VRDNLVAVHTNRAYTFSFYIKADCPGPAAVRIECATQRRPPAVQTVFDRTFNVDATWQRVAFTSPKCVAVFADEYDRFMLCLYAAPADQPQPTGTVWIDDVSDRRAVRAVAGNVRLINPRTLAYAPLNHRSRPATRSTSPVHADKPVRRATRLAGRLLPPRLGFMGLPYDRTGEYRPLHRAGGLPSAPCACPSRASTRSATNPTRSNRASTRSPPCSRAAASRRTGTVLEFETQGASPSCRPTSGRAA